MRAIKASELVYGDTIVDNADDVRYDGKKPKLIRVDHIEHNACHKGDTHVNHRACYWAAGSVWVTS